MSGSLRRSLAWFVLALGSAALIGLGVEAGRSRVAPAAPPPATSGPVAPRPVSPVAVPDPSREAGPPGDGEGFVELRVLAEDGTPLAGATVWTRPTGASRRGPDLWSGSNVRPNGVAQRVLAGTTLDVVATAPGFVSGEAEGVGADTTLRLRRAKPSRVTVKLADTVAAPPASLELNARLVWCGTAGKPRPADQGDPRMRTHPVGPTRIVPGGTVTFDVAEPGRWQAVLGVTKSPAGNAGSELVMPTCSPEIVVGEEPQRFEILLDADPERYAAVLARNSK